MEQQLASATVALRVCKCAPQKQAWVWDGEFHDDSFQPGQPVVQGQKTGRLRILFGSRFRLKRGPPVGLCRVFYARVSFAGSGFARADFVGPDFGRPHFAL